MSRAKVQQALVLSMSTLAFTVCFMVWMMFAVLGVPIKELLQLNETQFGLLAATPVLTGAILRLPFGLLTDRFGGRVVMVLLLLVSAVPVWISSYAQSLWQFLVLGLFLGLVGAAFSLAARKAAQGFDSAAPPGTSLAQSATKRT